MSFWFHLFFFNFTRIQLSICVSWLHNQVTCIPLLPEPVSNVNQIVLSSNSLSLGCLHLFLCFVCCCFLFFFIKKMWNVFRSITNMFLKQTVSVLLCNSYRSIIFIIRFVFFLVVFLLTPTLDEAWRWRTENGHRPARLHTTQRRWLAP